MCQCRLAHKSSLASLDIPSPMWQALISLLQQPDNVLLYRGHWSSDSRRVFDALPRQHSPLQTKQWQNAIALITRTLTAHSLELHHLITASDPLHIMRFSPTQQPSTPATQAPVIPVYVDNYNARLHTIPLDLPAIHTPQAIPKAIKTISTNTRSDTPLRNHLYPPQKPTKKKITSKKKLNKAQDQPTSSSSTPSATTHNSVSKRKMISSAVSVNSTTPPTYIRPVKRVRSTIDPSTAATILHHFPRIGSEPVRKRPHIIAPTMQFRQLHIKPFLEREVNTPPSKMTKLTSTSKVECACNCHITFDSRQIICGSSSRPSYVSNVSSRNHSNSSSSSSKSSSLISSMSFPVVSSKPSDVSNVSHSISSSKNFFFDFDHEPCLVCLLCLCLRGRFRPP